MATKRIDKEQRPSALGRPPVFKSAGELEALISDYLRKCEPHVRKSLRNVKDAKGKWSVKEIDTIIPGKPITWTGLCVYLGIDRHTLNDYEEKKTFSTTLKRYKAMCEAYAEELLLNSDNRNAAGVIFSMKNNYGWVDKREEDHNFPNGGMTVVVQQRDDGRKITD
jgi:hypothetical protein